MGYSVCMPPIWPEWQGRTLICLGYMRYAFDSPVKIEEDYGNKYVTRVSEMVRMVRREKHRMEAFVRFQELTDGTFYAGVEPDFNVLPLLIRHFKSRYADQKWMIYDIKRKYGIYYDLHDTQFIEMDFADLSKPNNVLLHLPRTKAFISTFGRTILTA
jgi:probable DNA metabolism protein